MQTTLNNEFNYARTENGALAYKTSGKELLDLNFAVSSLRNATENDIINRFKKAFFEDKVLAMKWLFYARDVRQGLGERRLFRVVLKDLAKEYPNMVESLISLIPEYGRYDDLWCLLEDDVLSGVVIKLVDKQLVEDFNNMEAQKNLSLLAKWMPSTNTSSKQTKRYAKILCKGLGLTEREYRKLLSSLRAYINVVEVKMSAKKWSEINYETVPSRANLIYKNAFLRNDEERRREYLSKLQKGEAKINASVLFPYDVVHKYTNGGMHVCKQEDDTIEALWKALPSKVCDCNNTIVVADSSGSMTCRVGNTTVSALDVANSLAIYFAEHNSGQFKDKFITFSERPQLVDLSNCGSLHEKVQKALVHSEVANTNIEKVFDLILATAVNNKINQEDMPQNVLIISDMEFDSCATYGNGYHNRPTQRLFDVIAKRFVDAGYKMPRLVFHNVASRTNAIPIKENELGVALVSGFSTNIIDMILSGKTNPYECLLEVLNSERYKAVEDAIID